MNAPGAVCVKKIRRNMEMIGLKGARKRGSAGELFWEAPRRPDISPGFSHTFVFATILTRSSKNGCKVMATECVKKMCRFWNASSVKEEFCFACPRFKKNMHKIQLKCSFYSHMHLKAKVHFWDHFTPRYVLSSDSIQGRIFPLQNEMPFLSLTGKTPL